ncbi:hypothetical protein R6X41_06920 [Formosa sp. PL04]|nr:hypothetical protein [Formosa sp. PL04]MDW5288540.1 hypothetical protein [Formosa sp. PL04]
MRFIFNIFRNARSILIIKSTPKVYAIKSPKLKVFPKTMRAILFSDKPITSKKGVSCRVSIIKENTKTPMPTVIGSIWNTDFTKT